MNILKPHKARHFENWRERKAKIGQRGSTDRRIIHTRKFKMPFQGEIRFHATKGWRLSST